MGAFVRGDVVVAPFPFSDLSATKKRPACGGKDVTKVVDGLMTIVRGLRPNERREFLNDLLGSGLLAEDERDHAIIESRRGGPTRPLGKCVASMKRKGRVR